MTKKATSRQSHEENLDLDDYKKKKVRLNESKKKRPDRKKGENISNNHLTDFSISSVA
jgi:hypothetical protein